ncbi:hypothetical protein H311_00199 [Anncaliia algerae PRA109]|nr:hypothetical protein H311_00199 [Anncaliia algerae PRA109]
MTIASFLTGIIVTKALVILFFICTMRKESIFLLFLHLCVICIYNDCGFINLYIAPGPLIYYFHNCLLASS